MIKRLTLLALLVAAPVLQAQTDLTGTWTGAFVMILDGGEARNDTAVMVLTQKGTEVSGTAGPNLDQQWPILKGGKIDGAAVTFGVQTDGPLIEFTLKLVDGRLKGDAKAEMDGRKMTATLDMERKPK